MNPFLTKNHIDHSNYKILTYLRISYNLVQYNYDVSCPECGRICCECPGLCSGDAYKFLDRLKIENIRFYILGTIFYFSLLRKFSPKGRKYWVTEDNFLYK